MGDLTKGETFAAGEVVTAARLHALVENATLNAGSVGTAKLADGAVTTAKLDSGLQVASAKVQLASGKTLVGNGSGVADQVTVDTGTMQTSPTVGVKTGGIAATQLASDAVTTAKILDANVTGAKLETLSPSPAGSYGSASAIPVVTVDSKGRVTAASTAAAPMTLTRLGSAAATPPYDLAMPTGASVVASWAWAGSTVPSIISIQAICIVPTASAGGWQQDDIIPIEHIRCVDNPSGESFQGLYAFFEGSGSVGNRYIKVRRVAEADVLYVGTKSDPTNTSVVLTPTEWRLRGHVLTLT